VIRLAIVQMAMGEAVADNVERALGHVRAAARRGAQVVLLPELFASVYFPQREREECFALAHEVDGHPFLARFRALAGELGVVLPVSFFERAGPTHYNSVAVVDADGAMLGLYRKSHIPDGPGYEEKFYFTPGDTGFRAWPTRHGRLGVGVCWDQWFPESARCMALLGADLLLYPTAIGSEPPEAGALDTRDLWQRAMLGHAVANSCYLAAANRVGREGEATFYGRSFVCDYTGRVLAQAGEREEDVLLAEVDLDAARAFRASMGFFRDRRPDLYGALLTLDGTRRVDRRG
jgi:N-carbamoylputrescine amidase